MAGGDARPTVPLEDEQADDPEWRAEFLRLARAVRQARTQDALYAAKAALEAFETKGKEDAHQD